MEFYSFSEHAKRRMKERGYTEDDIALAISYGKKVLQPEGNCVFRVNHHVIREADRNLQKCLKKISNIKVVVNPSKNLVITVMEYVRQSWLERQCELFSQRWKGYEEFEENERFLFGGILYCLMDASLRPTWIQRKHDKFYLHKEVVHDGSKIFRKDRPDDVYGLEQIRNFFTDWLKFNRKCPTWSGSLAQLNEFIDEISEVKTLKGESA